MKQAVGSAAILLFLISTAARPQEALPEPASKPRVIISTDLGGSDEDDIQSFIHYLTYADRFDTEGILSSPPGAGRAADILGVLDTYASDWQWMRAHADFPHARALRKLVKQGAVSPSPRPGFSAPTQGSEWIISRAREDDARPLWLLVWGGITDLAQALHDAPDIRSKLRVHFIGSWNLRQDPHAFAYIAREHPELFMIHNETTFRGWYRGGDQSQSTDLGNETFVDSHIAGHGALGERFTACHAGGAATGSIKMGDTPTVAYLLRGVADDPTLPHWGGRFVRLPERPNWFVDDPAPSVAETPHPGARTVNRWRSHFLRDWQRRMDWCIPSPSKPNWSTIGGHSDKWLSGNESREIAANVLSHQASSGGWPKNIGTFQHLFHGDPDLIDATIDNGATVGEIRFLSRMAARTGDSRFRESCLKGIDYILAAQDIRSGGWPQRHPLAGNYSRHITYNDDAMVNALRLVRDIGRQVEPFASIVDEKRRLACVEALARGIRCILHSQIIQNGRLTAWCAQHDRSTLLPCLARSYEHPTLSGMESAGILLFLMEISAPTPGVVAAVHAGAHWFSQNHIDGMRVERDTITRDVILRADSDAPLLWARFYELGTNRPVFSGRDGIIRHDFGQIERERRNHYSWFTDRPTGMLEHYEKWVTRHPEEGRGLNVFDGIERPLRANPPAVPNREIAVRNHASTANIDRAMRIDYPADSTARSTHDQRVILCPAGDYRHLKLRQAHRYAQALAELGIPTTILKYRAPLSLEGRFNAAGSPLADLIEVVRQLRAESHPDEKIGILGAEAGGHLALMAAVHHDLFDQSAGPDFIAVANLPTGVPPDAWMTALLGDNAKNRPLRHFYSAEFHANANMCPAHFSFRPRSVFKAAAVRFIDRLRQRGTRASLSADLPTSSHQLPVAFLRIIDRKNRSR